MSPLQNPSQQHSVQQLLTQHLDIWTTAETEKKSGRGRASGNAGSVYGIKKLRELILELAVRGKLVPQDPNDEPANELLKRIQAEKAKLVAEGKLKKEKPLAPIGEDEKTFELPRGWVFARLREVATHLGDGLHGTPVYNANGKYYFVNGNNLKDGKIVIKHETKTVDVMEYEKYKKPLNTSSILVSINGTLGTVGFYDGEPIILGKSACYINLVQEKINKYFVKLLIDAPSFMKYAIKNAAGTTIRNLGLKAINEMPIALPPIAEQHRIVAKVDELMALCDQLENQHLNAAEAHETLVSALLDTLTHSQNAAAFQSHWQRIAVHFDTLFTTEASIDALRQTLLQLAVMGKLVPQDQNDEPASELLKRIQAEKAKLMAEGKIKKEKPLAPISEDEKPFELPRGWEWARVIDCSVLVTDGEHATPPRTLQKEIPLVTAKNVRDGYFDYDDTDYVELINAKKCWKRCKPERGDILMVSVGATLGRLAILKESKDMVIVRSVTLIRPCLLDAGYLSVALNSPLMQKTMWAGVKQMAQPGLYLAQSSSMALPLPPLAEQNHIVAKFDQLMALCDQLKVRVTEASQLQQRLADVIVEQAVSQ